MGFEFGEVPVFGVDSESGDCASVFGVDEECFAGLAEYEMPGGASGEGEELGWLVVGEQDDVIATKVGAVDER